MPHRRASSLLVAAALLVGCSTVTSVTELEPQAFEGADGSAQITTGLPDAAPATPVPPSAAAPTSAPEPELLAEPVAEPVALSGRAQLDQLIIDTHDSLDGTLSIAAFHGAVEWWCQGLGADLGSLPEPEKTAVMGLLASCELRGQDHYPDGATGLSSWDEIMDFRWGRVVWWDDQAAFVERMETMCDTDSALDLPLDGLSTSAFDEILSVRYTGECRYLASPADPLAASDQSGELVDLNLGGTILFNDLSNGLWSYDVASGHEQRLVDGVGTTTHAALSPAGDAVVFVHEDRANRRLAHLSILDFDQGECRHLASLSGFIDNVEWEDHGQRFALSMWDRGTRGASVEVMNRHGERTTILEGEPASATLAKGAWIDTASILTAINESGQGMRWQMRSPDGGFAAPLAHSDDQRVIRNYAAVTPDAQLVFTSGDELMMVDVADITLAPADTTELFADAEIPGVEVFPTGDGIEGRLEVSPNGRWLKYITYSGLTPTGAFVSALDDPGPRIDLLGSLLEPGEVFGGAGVWAPDSSGLLVTVGDHVVGPTENHFFSVDGQRVNMGFGRTPFAWHADQLDLARVDCAPTPPTP